MLAKLLFQLSLLQLLCYLLLITCSDADPSKRFFGSRNDPRLFKDDVDIRFSRTLNSCKLPQIRYASPDRLFERLTDLRFLSIDFLNTFLLTYRVFTDSITVIEALKRVHYTPEMQLNAMTSSSLHDSSGSLDGETGLPKAGHEASGSAAAAGHHLHPSGPSPHHGNILNINTAGQSTLPQAGVAAANELLSTTIEYDYGRRVSTSSVLSDIAELGGSGRDNLHRESVVEVSAQQQQQAVVAQQNQVFSASSPVIRNSQHWRLSYRKCMSYFVIVYDDQLIFVYLSSRRRASS